MTKYGNSIRIFIQVKANMPSVWTGVTLKCSWRSKRAGGFRPPWSCPHLALFFRSSCSSASQVADRCRRRVTWKPQAGTICLLMRVVFAFFQPFFPPCISFLPLVWIRNASSLGDWSFADVPFSVCSHHFSCEFRVWG